jgi:hypothetical protein
MEIEIAKPHGNGKFVVPCGECGCATYGSQRSGRAVVAKQILLDSMKDHLIPRIVGKKTAKEMYDAFETLY